jgi:phage terminase large subunit
MSASLNPVLKDFWTTPARYRVLYGGRASGKSWDAAGFAVFLASRYRVRFLCTRQFQNKIAESVYTLIKMRAEQFGLAEQFKFTDNSIIHLRTKSEFIFYGISRNIDEIKSTESVDVLWMEEAHLLSREQWDIIHPTIRKSGSQIWVVFNPRFSTDFVYQRFVVNPLPNSVVKLINYTDNRFLSADMLSVIKNAELEDFEEFQHIYLGVPRADSDRVIIRRSWLESCIDAHLALDIPPSGRSVIGFDVADDGADKCANVHAHGWVATWSDEWKGQEDELLKSCSRTYDAAVRCDAAIRYDSIGVGALCGSKFDELNQSRKRSISYAKFNAADGVYEPSRYYARDAQEKIKNSDYFSNLKAQSWWLIADRVRNTHNAIKNGEKFDSSELISISSKMPNLERILTELSTPKRDFDANGRVKVESKKDLSKRGVSSPNLADAFVMAFAPEPVRPIKISASAIKRAKQ